MAQDDQQLFDRARSGDESALNQLLAQHLPDLHAYVRLRLGSKLRTREDSVDIVQSVCRDILENAGRFRDDPGSSFRAWLFTTAVRKILDRAEYWGAAKRDLARVTALAPKDGVELETQVLAVYRNFCSPSGEVIGRETLERIEKAFSQLPDDYQEVILLSRVVGLSRAEIAQRMDRTEASIRNLLPRALAELAERVEEGPEHSG